MKKILFLGAVLLCVCMIFSMTASATDSVETTLNNGLYDLNTTFEGNADEYYMIYTAVGHLRVKDGSHLPWEKTVSAEEFENVLNKYFAVDDSMLAKIRAFNGTWDYCLTFNYNEAENTYYCKVDGIPVGAYASYELYTYEEKDGAYEAYCSKIKYDYLSSALPDGTDEFEYADSLGWPEKITYNGKTYTQSEYGMEYVIKHVLTYGKKYTVELNGSTVRLLSTEDYTVTDLPDHEKILARMFTSTLNFVDVYYSYNLASYAAAEMNDMLNPKPWDDFSDTVIPAAIFEETFNKYFMFDDATLSLFKQYTKYNEAERTYTVSNMGGFGGGETRREYSGFRESNGIFEVFYSTLQKVYLKHEFESYEAYAAYVTALDYPDTLEYKGITYKNVYGDYESVSGVKHYGNKYIVDLNDNIVRIHSVTDFTEKDHPSYVPSLDEVFDNELWMLNSLYEYGPRYMIHRVSRDLFIEDPNDFLKPTVVSAEVYESTLDKYFAIDDDMLQAIRNYDPEYLLKYNEAEQTYTLYFVGGFGGILPEREYKCYGDNKDGTYDVFFNSVTYEFLSDVLPDGVTEDDVAGAQDWPDEITYNNNVYLIGPDGYYRVAEHKHEGKKFHVEVNDDWTVRILSVTDFVENDLPGYKPGDINGDYGISSDDAIYLLYNVLFGTGDYPVLQAGDFDGNGERNSDDAIYLLYHVLFGAGDYPLATE